jgi:hypothetical protein
MRRRQAPRPRRLQGEDGVFLVMWALLLVALLVMVAIAIDLDHARSSSRLDQSVADLAVLAGGGSLANGHFTSACTDAIKNLDLNLPNLPAISAASFCAQPANDVSQTVCSPGGTLTQAAPSITSGRYTVTLHFPVPDSEIAGAGYSGAGLNDGTPCQRMRIIITNTEPVFFSGIVGNRGLSVTRSATVRGHIGTTQIVPAMWLLDPTGCTSLAVSGGSQVTVGVDNPTPTPGIISIDSDGSACSSNQDTVSVGGAGSQLLAVPTTGSPSGAIHLFALPLGATTCSDPACNIADVSSGAITPQPLGAEQRATRAPADWRYNCKTGYPTYHGIVIGDCPNALTTQPYMDNLRSAIGTNGLPAGYVKYSAKIGCSTTGTINAPAGFNWLIDCPNFNISNGTDITFPDGNVVFDKNVNLKMTGGSISFNTNNPVAHLPAGCLTSVSAACSQDSSAAASVVYFRSGGNIAITGGTLSSNHALVYQDSGYVAMSGNPPVWTAPIEGPFAGLALWSELSSNKYQITGGGGARLTGTFFIPEAAPFTLSGGGSWGQQHAQFIAFQAVVTGGGNFDMVPDSTLLSIPPTSGFLIR